MTFIEKHATKIIIAFSFVLFLLLIQNCSTSRKLNKLAKNEDLSRTIINSKLDSIPTYTEFQKAIIIEGLRAEKRMIQATDRRILDVNRQTAIDEELKKLSVTE